MRKTPFAKKLSFFKQIAPMPWLLWGIALYFLALSAGAEANSRFRVPLMPILVLFAASGYGELRWHWHKVDQHRKRFGLRC